MNTAQNQHHPVLPSVQKPPVAPSPAGAPVGGVALMRNACRVRHYSRKTEEAYVGWLLRFGHHFPGRRLSQMGAPEIEQYLTHLAVNRHVAASTQNQAFAALVFFYRHVVVTDLGRIDAVRAKRPKRVPEVLSRDEVRRLLDHIHGVAWLGCSLLYGAGLRLEEGVRLRVKDLDFERGTLTVRRGKGEKDRVTMLPKRLHEPLQRHLEAVHRHHLRDVGEHVGVSMPDALDRKYPAASTSWPWWYVFPSTTTCPHPDTREVCRHHLDDSVFQKAVKRAARAAAIAHRVSPHTLRHCFATHLLEAGTSIETVRDLMGHKDVRTTQVYLHCLRPSHTTPSPLD